MMQPERNYRLTTDNGLRDPPGLRLKRLVQANPDGGFKSLPLRFPSRNRCEQSSLGVDADARDGAAFQSHAIGDKNTDCG
jgi:hypothetical protein